MADATRLAERESIRRSLLSAERYRRETVTLSVDRVRALLDDTPRAWDEGKDAGRKEAHPFHYAEAHPDPITNPYDED